MHDPFLRILRINRKGNPDLKKYIPNTSVISFFDSHPIPQFTQKEINAIENSLKNGENHSKAIKSYDNRLIPFITKPFQTIISLINPNDTSTIEYINTYILYIYISWIIYYENSNNIEFLDDLLELITTLYNSEFQDIAKECFLYSFDIYLLKNTFNSFPKYLQILITFFSKFKNFKEEDFTIFSTLFANLRMYNLDEYSFLFMSEFEKVVALHSNQIPKDVYDALMSNSMTFLINLKAPSIQFYRLLITHISDVQAEEVSSTLALVICQNVINFSRPISFPDGEGEQEEPIAGSFYIIRNFPTIQTFEKGLKFRFQTPELNLPSLKSIQDQEVMTKLQPLFDSIKQSKTTSIEIVKKMSLFLNRYEKEEMKEKKQNIFILYNLYIVFLSFLKVVLHHIINYVSFVELLYRKEIFNPSIYCFDPLNQTPEIINMNILRTETFRYILYDDTNRLTAFFDSFICMPRMFNEMVQRCIDNSHIIIAKIIESDCLIDVISNSLVFFQNLRYQGDKIYDETSSKIFYLISIISQDKRAKDLLFRNYFFCSAFLAQTYETKPREFVFSQIKSASYSLVLPNAFLVMIRSVFNFFPSDESVRLANELLMLINNIIATNRSLIERYSIIAQPLYKTLSKLIQSQQSAELLQSILSFFTEISYPISDDQYIRFSETIRKVYGNENDEVIFKRLIQFIAGDCLSSVNPSFIIHRPHATLMLFYMYSTSIKVINYIIQLCTYDIENCIACHEGRLDFFVLETLRSIWDDESADKEYLDALFKLFEVISTSSCSLEIIEKFVSLLSPINGKYLSPHYQLAIDTIFNIIRFESKIPLYQMPLKSYCSVKPSETIVFNKGFSFVAWLYIENDLSDEYPVLLRFWNDKNWSITITLRSNVVNFFESGQTYSISSNMDSYLPTHEWIKVVMTYFIDNIGLLNLYVNGIHASTIRTAMPEITDWNLHFSFGGSILSHKSQTQQTQENSLLNNSNADQQTSPQFVKKKRYSMLGPFALYPKLANEQILSVFNDNPNIFSPLETKPYMTHLPTAVNIFEKQTFYTLFVGKCYIYLIIPIFSLSNINFRNNERYKLLFESAVSILLESLSVCKEVEDQFYEIGGFRIISYLLSDANPIFLTYHLYTRFFTIFQSLKNEKLQEVLFSRILIDFSIWYASEEALLILKYIYRVVLPSSDHFASKYPSFEDVLKTILAFFSDQETHKVRPKTLNLALCRKILYSILLLNTPNYAQFQFLLNVTMNFNQDVDVKTELIDWICSFSEVKKDQFIKHLTKEESSIVFLKLIQKSINVTPIPIIALLSSLHLRSIINIGDFTSYVMVKINPSTASIELFEKLIELVNVNNIYQWFPLLCFVGMQLPWEYAKSIQGISIKKISSLNDWFFWPVIWALELKKEGQVSLMNLLAKDPTNWLQICALIEKCSQVKGQNPDDAINCFLSQACHYLIISELLLAKPISNYFQLIIGHHLFFRHTNELNQKCYNIIAETYGEDEHIKASNIPLKQYSSLKEMSSSDISHIISDENLPEIEVLPTYNETGKDKEYELDHIHFGIRLDDDMEWIDFELAKAFLYIISNYKTILDLDLYVLTTYFFAETSHNDAETTKYIGIGKQLNLSDQQLSILNHRDNCDLTTFIESFFYKKYSSLKVNFSSHDENLLNFVRSKSVDNDFESTLCRSNSLLNSSGSKIFKLDSLDSSSNNQGNELTEDDLFPNSNSNRGKDRKLWKRLRKNLTQEGKPWESMTLWKEQCQRDSALCSIGCPFKMIQKWKSAKQTAELIANEIVYGVQQTDELSYSTEMDTIQIEESCINAMCTIIKINSPDEELEISVYRSIIYIKRKKPKIIHILSITSLLAITYNSKQTAIEITLDDGKSYFFVFQTTATRDQIFDQISASIHEHQDKKSIPFVFQSQRTVPHVLINSWMEHRISNFSYILLLNKMSGCSFNVDSQYPIFPRILDDFNDIESIRNYSKTFSYSEEPPLFYLQRIDPFDKISKREFNNVSQISKKFELTPEFFYLPEFLISEVQTQNVKLPNWASSPFDFVYKLRKVLESEEVSLNLNKWFDFVWGSFSVLYCKYLPLFETPHPQRLKLSDLSRKEPVFIERKIGENQAKEKEKEKIELEPNSKVISESIKWIAYFIPETKNVVYLKKKLNQNSLKTIDFSFDLNQISSSFISESFHTIAIGVDEGKIIFVHSLEHQFPVFLIHMEENCRADIISISPSWGFIVAVSSKAGNSKSITIFNINGLLIKKVQLNCSIDKIVCWTNRDEFDFIALTDSDGNVYVTEIYEMSENVFENPFYSCNCKTTQLTYNKLNDTLSIHTKDGKEIIKSVY